MKTTSEIRKDWQRALAAELPPGLRESPERQRLRNLLADFAELEGALEAVVQSRAAVLAELDRAKARIAELEAERDDAIQRDTVNAALTRAAIKKSDARIAELEAALNLDGNARIAAYATERERAAVLAERTACALVAAGMSVAANQPFPRGTMGIENIDPYALIIARDEAIATAIRARPAP